MTKYHVGIVGGGIAGLSTAFRLIQMGHSITIYDPTPSMGASHAAAGMLAPASEINFSELPLLRLMQHSNEMWSDFASQIEAASGETIGFRSEGTIVVGYDQNDAREIKRLAEFQAQLGIEVIQLTRISTKELEPALTSSIAYSALIKSDRQVNNRLLMAALTKTLSALGAHFVLKSVTELRRNSESNFKIELDDATEASPDIILLAPGAYLDSIKGLPNTIADSIRPVKGVILRVSSQGSTTLNHVVRAKVQGKTVYLVPRNDGEIVIGATQEEVGFDNTAKIRSIAEMILSATLLVPEMGEANLNEHTVRFRPGSIDNAPIVGQYQDSNLYLSLGHFRHGILLSAAISQALAEAIDSGRKQYEIETFGPDRLETKLSS